MWWHKYTSDLTNTQKGDYLLVQGY